MQAAPPRAQRFQLARASSARRNLRMTRPSALRRATTHKGTTVNVGTTKPGDDDRGAAGNGGGVTADIRRGGDASKSSYLGPSAYGCCRWAIDRWRSEGRRVLWVNNIADLSITDLARPTTAAVQMARNSRSRMSEPPQATSSTWRRKRPTSSSSSGSHPATPTPPPTSTATMP